MSGRCKSPKQQKDTKIDASSSNTYKLYHEGAREVLYQCLKNCGGDDALATTSTTFSGNAESRSYTDVGTVIGIRGRTTASSSEDEDEEKLDSSSSSSSSEEEEESSSDNDNDNDKEGKTQKTSKSNTKKSKRKHKKDIVATLGKAPSILLPLSSKKRALDIPSGLLPSNHTSWDVPS
eukprot:436187-Ditylum_brightwellii.AAC.1